MAKKRKIVFEIPENKAALIEERERSERSLDEIARDLLLGLLEDKRRTTLSTKLLGVAWPTDWYERMLRDYGEGGIGATVRALIYNEIKDNDRMDVEAPPDLREVETKHVKRKVTAHNNRKSTVQHVVIPYSYYEVLLMLHGDGWVSTWVKSVVYRDLNRRAKKRDPQLSVPRRLNHFL